MTEESIDVFAFTEAERSTYPFLGDYERRVRESVREGIANTQWRDRYCLVGLFPTYRAFNHWGIPFDTSSIPEDTSEPHRTRIATFRSLTGRDVCSASEYVRLLGLRSRLRLGPLATLGLGRTLASFVRKKSSPWSA